MTRETDLAPYPSTVAPQCPAHTRHAVRQAAARKARAMAQPWQPDGYLCSVAREAIRDAQRQTVLTLARRSLWYARHRATIRGGYGCGDPIARREWNAIAHGVPVRAWDAGVGEYVTQVWGRRP